MASSKYGKSTNALIAAGVTVFGVVVIWGAASMQQANRTEELYGHWVGEQWDVARQCIVGTPIGRGSSTEELETILRARALTTIAEASESDEELEPSLLWPARCVGILSSLDVDPALLHGLLDGHDPRDAVATLRVLLPRVIVVGEPGPDQLAVGDAPDRAAELAETIATLDSIMPSGAEYHLDAFEVAHVDALASVERSLDCPASRSSRPLRPFLEVDVVDELLMTGGTAARLSRNEEQIVVTRSGVDGATAQVVTPLAHHPRFWDDDELVWSLDETLVIASIETSEIRATSPPLGFVPEQMAICRYGADVAAGAVFVIAHSDSLVVLRWTPGSPIAEPTALRPSPPSRGVWTACDADTLALAWYEEDVPGWRFSICDERSCRTLPPLDVGGDLQLEVDSGRVLVTARGRRTDLPLARVLTIAEGDEATWSAPTIVARGRSSVVEDGFEIRDPCTEARVRSADGLTWAER